MSFVPCVCSKVQSSYTWLVIAISVGMAAGCGDDSPDPDFPADYATHYTEVRDCRSSTEHDFANVRVLADPLALGPYQDRATPFPEGAVVLKEEYDLGDDTCTGEVQDWTVMRRLADGASPETLDWHWQKVAGNRHVTSDDEPRCWGCHVDCGVPPDGYAGTCAVP